MNITITDKEIIIEHENKKETKPKSEIRTPSNRDILFLQDVVIKFDNPRTMFGEGQCQHEAEKYLEIEDEDKKYFATVLDSGDGWITMEKVTYLHPEKCNIDLKLKADKILQHLKTKYSLCDLHYKNWGVRENGDPIIFDYGV